MKNLLSLCTLVIIGYAAADVLRFKPAQFDAEEQHSNFMPDHFRCDSCRAIAYQMFTAFLTYNTRHKSKKNIIPSYELIAISENACKNNIYEAYGVKSVDGDVRINGPGVDYPGAGVIAGGSNWPGRISKMCQEMFEEFEEEDIYSIYLDNLTSLEGFTDALLDMNKRICKCNAEKRKRDEPLSEKPRDEQPNDEL